MKNVVIVDGVRLAIGKLGGSLIDEPADYLAATVLDALVERTGIDKNAVDEIILGQAKQTADISNIGRVASIRAGFPLHIPGYTVHRQCGSGLQAVNNAVQQIQCGYAEIIIAGGAESMSTAPYYVNGTRFGTKAGNVELKDPNTASQAGSQPYEEYGNLSMGYTAENIAEKYNIPREKQDAFALSSQEKAEAAIKSGKFKEEIVPYTIKTRKSEIVFDTDEHPRTTTLGALGKLKPVFKTGGTVTAGNSSGRNDGAAALLVMSEEKADELGVTPMVRVIAQAAVGCDPLYMGMGPVHATQKALKQVNLSIDDIDVVELNEAFAAQSIACIEKLGIDEAKVNPNGGAIALGHPIGATGAILATKLIHELVRSNKRFGLITLCIAGGLGIATIVENVQYNL
ncbi:thiolase family protein [Ureibacillus aquaedulcis]|uniref:acetyl-CoA C-acetyltransferase n=1 Tax=Ureibacillus aquaedulcis TaxID=3058421 RepID=A0ABT8GMQ6_9BACL|nr:thiolase family protein [Ureibacillus sp. BA0131]MDN4492684.1 thiolase family protein [Ureibacillus sp. BA0131]